MRTLIGGFLLVVAASVAAQDGLLSATGFGTVDPDAFASKSQGKMMATRAAQVDALRQLTEAVKGVQLTGGTTVEEYEVTSDMVATRVRGLVRGAFVVDRKVVEEDDAMVAEITMAICVTDAAAVCEGKETLQNVVDASE